MTTPTRDDGLPEPVAWLQVGVFDGPYEGETLTRAKLPLKYDPSWWRFDGLYSGDQMRAYGDARAAAAMAEATKYRRTLEWRLRPKREGVSMQAVWDKERQMLTLPEHGIPRPEWERRFCDKVKRTTGTGDEVAAAELEGWPEADDDWLTVTPEDAASESLSYWTDDE